MASLIVPARLARNPSQGMASDTGPPRSATYDDIYHDAEGVGEVERVFMAPAGLEARFAKATNATVTIGELGFGTGLNFAVIVRSFLRHSPASARLHFVSVEKHPLSAEHFAPLIHRRRTDLPAYDDLAADHPALLPGWHRRHCYAGRVTLSVFYGDAFDGVSDLAQRMQRPVDHWLLDGFTPARNPDMWSPALFKQLAKVSAQGTTACTFSAAGGVRRALTDAGFRVTRIDQQPHKRHSTFAAFDGARRAFRPPVQVQILGSGLAGSCAARTLAERGIDVQLLHEPNTAPVTIPMATANPRLLANDSADACFRLRSYHYSGAWLTRFAATRRDGILQLATTADQLHRMETVAEAYGSSGPWIRRVDCSTAANVSEIPLKVGGLLLRDACTVDLDSLLRELVDHPRIQSGSIETARVDDTLPRILCLGAATNHMPEARYLELRPVWGQLELLTLDHGPRLPLIGAGVVTPGVGCYGVGSSYEQSPWDPVRAQRFNLDRLEAWWREAVHVPLRYRATGRVRGCRAVTSDRVPVIGSLHDARGHALDGQFVSTGHGSHGTLSAPLAADCLAAQINGEFAILDSAEAECVDGLRFIRRQARRGAL